MNKADIIKQLPKVLAVAGALGVPVTAYLSVKAGMKSERQMHEAYEVYCFKDSFVERFKLTWKNYIPPVVSGLLTVGAIIGGYSLTAKQIAGLIAVGGSLATYKDELEAKIEEKFGKQSLDEIKKEIAEEVYSPTSVEETGNGDILCYESYSGRWFRSSKKAVERAERALNRRFDAGAGEYVCLNDFYTLLGLAESHFGFEFGWAANKDYYDGDIRFENAIMPAGSFMNIPEEVLVIELTTNSYPMAGYFEV